MRGLAPLCFLFFFSLISCVKQPNEDPVPVLEYQAVQAMGKYVTYHENGQPSIRDSAVLVLNYSDGDGDIFRDNTDDGPNVVYYTYAFLPDSNKYVIDQGPSVATITQPAGGYYKDKAIHGEIFIPMREFRSPEKPKIVRFEAFVEDMKGHKSNVVVTPTFTLDF
jgi:hypothetical protein